MDQTGFKVRNGVVVFDYANAQPVITAIGELSARASVRRRLSVAIGVC